MKKLESKLYIYIYIIKSIYTIKNKKNTIKI